jgi:acetylornithine/succinyldiaminopimelate/putrescine aminotransferase
MLKQLQETKHGAPLVDDEDVPEHLRSTTAPPRENEWDVDGNQYIDFQIGQGALLYGHAPAGMAEAIAEQAKLGTHSSSTTPPRAAIRARSR